MAPAQRLIGGVQVPEHRPVRRQHETAAAVETAADAAEQGFLVHARSECRTWPIAIEQQQFDITDTKHAAQRGQVYRPQAAVAAVSYPTIDHDSVVPR